MTDEFDDFDHLLEDPDFPERPQHPDFWRLSQIVLGMDAITESDEGTEGLERVLAEADVDSESLVYMASIRGARAVQIMSDAGGALRDLAAMSYIDGFIAGARYHEAKTADD